jgi:hypothetical protein
LPPSPDEFDLDHRRTASAASRWWLAAGLVVVAALAIGGYLWLDSVREAEELSTVTADPGRLTLAADDGGNLTNIAVRSSPEIFYRVTLRQAPIGRRLGLTCDWIAPNGQTLHRNYYRTQTIDKAIWPTYARWRLGAAAPLGQWTVRLSLGDREIGSTRFIVEAGPGVGAVPPAGKPAEAGE